MIFSVVLCTLCGFLHRSYHIPLPQDRRIVRLAHLMTRATVYDPNGSLYCVKLLYFISFCCGVSYPFLMALALLVKLDLKPSHTSASLFSIHITGNSCSRPTFLMLSLFHLSSLKKKLVCFPTQVSSTHYHAFATLTWLLNFPSHVMETSSKNHRPILRKGNIHVHIWLEFRHKSTSSMNLAHSLATAWATLMNAYH
jgi:hypothetical protein